MQNTSLKLVLSFGLGILACCAVVTHCKRDERYRATTPEEQEEYVRQDSIKFERIKADMQAMPRDTLHLVR